MSDLRERRKNETREKILSASRETFFSKSYANTTVEEIADRAGIAVGTVYNFYKTKADLLIAVVAREAGVENQDFTLEASDLEQGVVDIIMDYTWKSLGKLKFLNKKIWKELMAAMFSTLKSENKLLKGLFNLDFQYIENFKALLENLKKRGALVQSFDVDTAAMIVYSIFLTQFLLFIYSDNTTFEFMEQAIRKQVGLLFEGKCLDKGQKA